MDDSLHPFITKTYFGLWGRDSKQWHTGQPTAITYTQLLQKTIVPLPTWLATVKADELMAEVSLSYSIFQGVYGDSIVASGALDQLIRDLAQAVKAHGDPVFIRPGFEPSTLRFQIGAPYIDAYRRIVDLFREEGVENAAFIWCFGCCNGPEMAIEGNWFPGDEYVDWIGLDLFTPESFAPEGGNPYPPTVLIVLELASKWRKPIILSETSAVFAGGISDTTQAAAVDYWNTWFGPFFALLQDNPRIKAFNYINWNWPDHGYQWVDSRIENNPFLVDMLAAELSKSKYAHRSTPNKFNRPYLAHIGGKVSVSSGSPATYRLLGLNADPLQTGQPFQAAFFWSANLIKGTPSTGYINYTLGTLQGSNYWFIGSPYGLLAPTLNADGSFELTLPFAAGQGLEGNSLYVQAAVAPPSQAERTTQWLKLDILP